MNFPPIVLLSDCLSVNIYILIFVSRTSGFVSTTLDRSVKKIKVFQMKGHTMPFSKGRPLGLFQANLAQHIFGRREFFFSKCRAQSVSIRKNTATCWKYFEDNKKISPPEQLHRYILTTHGKTLLWVIEIYLFLFFLQMKNYYFLKTEIIFFFLFLSVHQHADMILHKTFSGERCGLSI